MYQHFQISHSLYSCGSANDLISGPSQDLHGRMEEIHKQLQGSQTAQSGMNHIPPEYKSKAYLPLPVLYSMKQSILIYGIYGF